MLKSLAYQVTFTSTGKSLAKEINFEPGLGAITGPNEAGKSFVVEMIRYAFFGSAALRGKAEDYQNLAVELVFLFKGIRFKTVRGAKSVLLREGQEVAVGTRPVNAKIIELLGFGLDVFDVACSANQGDVERLGAMKPAERKKMVDSVIGLSIIDDLAGWAAEQAREAGKEAEVIERVTVQPVEPAPPPDYQPSSVLEERIGKLEALNREYLTLKGLLSVEKTEPEAPQTDIDDTAETLKRLAAEQAELRASSRALMAQLKTIPPARHSKEMLEMQEVQHEAFDGWCERQRFETRHPTPSYSAEDLTRMRETWEEIARSKATERLSQDLNEAMAKGHHHCPKCDHHWPIEAEHITSLERQIALGVHIRPPTPPLDPGGIKLELSLVDDYARTLPERRRLGAYSETKEPALSRAEIAVALASWERVGERASLEAELLTLERLLAPMPDYPQMFSRRLAYEAALGAHQVQLRDYEAWVAQRGQAKLRLEEIEPRLTPLAASRAALHASLAYEHAFTIHTGALRIYEQRQAEIALLKEQERDWRNAKAALINLRTMIKQHLVPSLSRVASSLIASMTGGQRRSISVDQDFDIKVDEQPLNTLSGSAKAVANLALRLGLGQVLTNNVLSLFIGDEIDSAMDKDRAEATATTMANLKSRISQILLVTHKAPVADYTIGLGGT